MLLFSEFTAKRSCRLSVERFRLRGPMCRISKILHSIFFVVECCISCCCYDLIIMISSCYSRLKSITPCALRNSSKIFDYRGTGKDSTPRSRRQKVASRDIELINKSRQRDEENRIAENTNTYLNLSLEVYHTMHVEKPDKDI